jgi:nucleotide-binding universal stress UspA family protein
MYKKILVPCDGSDLARRSVFAHVEALGKQMGAEVIILSVIPSPRGRSGAAFRARAPEMPISLPETPEDARIARHPVYRDREIASAEHEARRSLGKAEAMLRDTGVKVNSTILLGDPAEEIVDFAEEETVDLIVMCSHGASGITRWVFGSVTEKVLRASSTPVLVIPPKELEEETAKKQ